MFKRSVDEGRIFCFAHHYPLNYGSHSRVRIRAENSHVQVFITRMAHLDPKNCTGAGIDIKIHANNLKFSKVPYASFVFCIMLKSDKQFSFFFIRLYHLSFMLRRRRNVFIQFDDRNYITVPCISDLN